MIKGKSTIQLFDAQTGEEVKKVVNNNMVTNAINNMLNVPQELCLYGSFKSLMDRITPIQTVALGGVMLWDSVLPEDPNQIYPPAGITNVGYAGDTYSGNNTYRGTYNSNESGAIPNGYRHVWDFATDRANGTIKSLSLTSRRGGNTGLHYDGNDRVCGLQNYLTTTGNYDNGPLGEFLGLIARDQYVFKDYRTDYNTIILKYAHHFAPDSITLDKTIGYYNNVYATKTLTTTNPCNEYYIVYSTKPIAYVYRWYNNTVYYACINFAEGTLLSEGAVAITSSDYRLDFCAGVTDDGIYMTAYDNTTADNLKYVPLLYDFDGKLIRKVTAERWGASFYNAHQCRVRQLGDKWYFDGYGTLYNIDNIRDNISNDPYNYGRGMYYSYNNKTLAPYYLSTGDDPNYQEVWLNTFWPYLGTINNLAEPVTKTASQTMKITYELTNEGG